MSRMADLQATVDQLTVRFQVVEDNQAIKKRQDQYGFYLDNRMLNVVVAAQTGGFIFHSAPASNVFPPDAQSFEKDRTLGHQCVPFHYPHPVAGADVPSPSGTHINITKRG